MAFGFLYRESITLKKASGTATLCSPMVCGFRVIEDRPLQCKDNCLFSPTCGIFVPVHSSHPGLGCGVGGRCWSCRNFLSWLHGPICCHLPDKGAHGPSHYLYSLAWWRLYFGQVGVGTKLLICSVFSFKRSGVSFQATQLAMRILEL